MPAGSPAISGLQVCSVDTAFGVLCYEIDAEGMEAEFNKFVLIIRVIRKEASCAYYISRRLQTVNRE